MLRRFNPNMKRAGASFHLHITKIAPLSQGFFVHVDSIAEGSNSFRGFFRLVPRRARSNSKLCLTLRVCSNALRFALLPPPLRRGALQKILCSIPFCFCGGRFFLNMEKEFLPGALLLNAEVGDASHTESSCYSRSYSKDRASVNGTTRHPPRAISARATSA